MPSLKRSRRLARATLIVVPSLEPTTFEHWVPTQSRSVGTRTPWLKHACRSSRHRRSKLLQLHFWAGSQLGVRPKHVKAADIPRLSRESRGQERRRPSHYQKVGGHGVCAA